VVCTNGRAKLSQDQDRQLFSESAGTCLLCNTRLFFDSPSAGRSVSIAERAHIVAHSAVGPRGDRGVSADYRSNPANIVLLCPTCHTRVDKSPDAYPTELLLTKKTKRAEAVANIGGTPTFNTREDARRAVRAILERNEMIFHTAGPSADDGSLPSTEAANKWSRLILAEIAPGNELIVAIVAMNPRLTTASDRSAAELLRLHNKDLAEKHREGSLVASAQRFPKAAHSIFLEEMAVSRGESTTGLPWDPDEGAHRASNGQARGAGSPEGRPMRGPTYEPSPQVKPMALLPSGAKNIMLNYKYNATWFASKILGHDEVTGATVLDNGYVEVKRREAPAITIAPVIADRINLGIVESIFESGTPTVILLVPKEAHYDWTAREFAEKNGSTIHTYKELCTSMCELDPRGFVDKKVAYARQRLEQHSKMMAVEMICEASMRLNRHGGLSDVTVAVEYEYEFSEEAMVCALARHPDVDVVLNSNPNGRPTSAALTHAAHTKIPIFSFTELMGALNYDGENFRAYQPPQHT
jgi:hypothetical protein